VKRLETAFRSDLKGCERITYEEWKRRGIWVKMQEAIASLLQEQV
jgi:hypothetical protein